MKKIICFSALLLLFALAVCEDELVGPDIPSVDLEYDEEYDDEADLDDEMHYTPRFSPEEAKHRLGSLVDKIDANQDKSLDVEELQIWIRNLFTKLNLEEAARQMKNNDADQDGKLTWEEFMQATYSMSQKEMDHYIEHDIPIPESKEHMINEVQYQKLKFTLADQDKSDSLDLEEYSAFLHPYDYSHMSDCEVKRVLREKDANNDGFLDETEYVGDMSDPEDIAVEKDNFKFRDKNSDEKLDNEEILLWVSPDQEDLAATEAENLMQETDNNKDGLLSKDEIVEKYQMWLTSEATNYGNLLKNEEPLVKEETEVDEPPVIEEVEGPPVKEEL